MKERNVLIVMLLMFAGSVVPLHAQTVIGFDHKDTANNAMAGGYTFGHEEKFEVQITGTNTDWFDYSVTGIELLTQQRPPAPAAVDKTTKTIKMEHDRRFGGYIVRVAIKANKKGGNANAKDKKLPESRVWYIGVETSGWHTEFSTGLVGSMLVDPEIILQEDDSGNMVPFRDESAEDELDFSFAAFATFYHDSWGNETHGIGASLGIDINDSQIGVLVGPTWRFGKHASLTAGYHWRKVDDLPAGVDFGVPFDGEELTLKPHTEGDWFVAISIRGFTGKKAKAFAEATTKKEDK